MKILVTGGTGHVGSDVVKELQKRNADIRVLVRKDDAAVPAGLETAIGDSVRHKMAACQNIQRHSIGCEA